VYFERTLKNLRSSTLFIFLGLAITSILLAFAIAKFGLLAGILGIIAIVGLPIVIFIISNIRFGFFLILVLSFFINYINRWTDGKVPLLSLEIILFFVVFGLILKEINASSTISIKQYFRSPIAIGLIIWVAYSHLQFFNPNSHEIIGKIIAIRQSWYSLLGFTVGLYVFDNIKSIKLFFSITLSLSLLAAFFGITQKYIGLLPYEKAWLYSSPERVRLFVNWGQIRVWSFLNDPTNFGLLMAASGLTCFILMTGPYKFYTKLVLALSGLVMFLAMISSGTRTAFVMVLVGFGIFGLINIKNIKTQVISVSVLLIFMTVYFGPFYSAPVLRIRSAFQGDKDPSMNVRLVNKDRIRPYLLSHPIGGGPNTTGGTLETSHELAGFPPDSGFLRIALEMGYIGLALYLWMYYTASAQLTSNYFQTENQEKRAIYLAILASMIAFCTAELTQITISQKPIDFLFFAYFALIVRLKDIK
jgi:putative inorganic carbon (hco3(-)) transporter